MFENYPEILNFNDVCDLLHISRPALYQLLKSGKLTGFKTGDRGWKIPKKDLISYIENSCRR